MTFISRNRKTLRIEGDKTDSNGEILLLEVSKCHGTGWVSKGDF